MGDGSGSLAKSIEREIFFDIREKHRRKNQGGGREDHANGVPVGSTA